MYNNNNKRVVPSEQEDYISIIIKKTNDELKYWTGIQIDPKSKKFVQDLQELSNIIFSVEMINGSKNMEKCINLIVRELTRKTIKNLVNELYIYKEKASRFTPLDDLVSNYDNENYVTPEYYGVNTIDSPQYSQTVLPPPQYIPPRQQPTIIQQQPQKSFSLVVKDDKLKLNEHNEYTFQLPNIFIKGIKLKNINLVNSDYNIDSSLTKIKVVDTVVNISEGYYKTIEDLLSEINSKLLDKNILFELNKINHRIRIKYYSESNNGTTSGSSGSVILQKTKKSVLQENIDLELNEHLAKILGFETGKLSGSSIYNARMLYKLPHKNKIYFTCKLVDDNFDIIPLLERHEINLENLKFMDEIKLSDIPNNFTNPNGVSLEMIKFELKYENGELYNSQNSPFSFVFEYIT